MSDELKHTFPVAAALVLAAFMALFSAVLAWTTWIGFDYLARHIANEELEIHKIRYLFVTVLFFTGWLCFFLRAKE